MKDKKRNVAKNKRKKENASFDYWCKYDRWVSKNIWYEDKYRAYLEPFTSGNNINLLMNSQ